MAIRNDLLDEPNDRLITSLLHITGMAPLYRWDQARRTMELTSAILYLDDAPWPDADQIGAAVEWAAGKCKLKPEQVSVQALPGGPDGKDFCAECGVERDSHEGMRMGLGQAAAHDFVWRGATPVPRLNIGGDTDE
jgi:hypothetical protein